MSSKLAFRALTNVACLGKMLHFSSMRDKFKFDRVQEKTLIDIYFKVKDHRSDFWFEVPFHKAVVLPTCTGLFQMVKEAPDANVIILPPHFSLQLVLGFLDLVYDGMTELSNLVTVDRLVELAKLLGVQLEQNSLVVVNRKKPSSKNNNKADIVTPKSLEIFPVPLNDVPLVTTTSTPVSRNVINAEKSCSPNDPQQLDRNHDGDGVGEDFPQNHCVGVRNVHRGKDITVAGMMEQTCEICSFSCRYIRDLQKHYDISHPNMELKCSHCDFTSNNYSNLMQHKNLRHSGAFGAIQCSLCGFKAQSKTKMSRHRKKVHELVNFMPAPDHLQNTIKGNEEGSIDVVDNAVDFKVEAAMVKKEVQDISGYSNSSGDGSIPYIEIDDEDDMDDSDPVKQEYLY